MPTPKTTASDDLHREVVFRAAFFEQRRSNWFSGWPARARHMKWRRPSALPSLPGLLLLLRRWLLSTGSCFCAAGNRRSSTPRAGLAVALNCANGIPREQLDLGDVLFPQLLDEELVRIFFGRCSPRQIAGNDRRMTSGTMEARPGQAR